MKPLLRLILLVAILFPDSAFSRGFKADTGMVGRVSSCSARKNESLMEIARRFGLGFNEIADANRGTDPFSPGRGARVVLPLSWILPDVTPVEGIVINLAEMRLYRYYLTPAFDWMVDTFPVGIGSEGNETPCGVFWVQEKRVNPSWRVPESIRQEKPFLPKVVPPGDDNPLGSHALRLSEGSILIHGTDKPWGVGRRVSHGCIRLYPEHVSALYHAVAVGELVTIINQPVKLAERENRVFVEIHDDGTPEDRLLTEADRLIARKQCGGRTDRGKLLAAVYEKNGMPVDITR